MFIFRPHSVLSFLIGSLLVCVVSTRQVFAQQPRQPLTEWAVQFQGDKGQESTGITHDGQGNIYTTGVFSGTSNFSPGASNLSYTAKGSQNIFISKTDKNGTLQWVKTFGDNGSNIGRAICADTLGNIYVTGEYYGTINFDTLKFTASKGMFVLKMDTSGQLIWAKSLGEDGFISPLRIAVDGQGSVYTTGEFAGTLDMDPGPGVDTISGANNDIFISKLDSAGQFAWAKSFGGPGVDRGYDITTDRWNNVYATGAFGQTVDFNPDKNDSFKITARGSRDVFIVKLNEAGHFLWAKSFEGEPSKSAQGMGIRTDHCGYVYSVGQFAGLVDFNPDPVQHEFIAANTTTLYLSKLDSSGNYVWVRSLEESILPNALELDAQGNFYVTGIYNRTADFNPGKGAADTFFLRSNGYGDVFLFKWYASGDFAWAKGFGGSVADAGRSLTIDKEKNVYTTGIFQKDVNFDAATLQSLPGSTYDIYLLKLQQPCPDASHTTLEVNLCDTGSYVLNCTTYRKSGSYIQSFTNVSGCDSIVTLKLSLSSIAKPIIRVDRFKLSTTLSYNTYQWLLNEVPIPGATDSSYEVKQNGNYRVAVSNEHGCIDTSDNYKVTNYTEGIDGISDLSRQVKVYPNPARDRVYIDAPVPVLITLSGIDGRILKQVTNTSAVPLAGLASGMYLIQIRDQNNRLIKAEKLILQ